MHEIVNVSFKFSSITRIRALKFSFNQVSRISLLDFSEKWRIEIKSLISLVSFMYRPPPPVLNMCLKQVSQFSVSLTRETQRIVYFPNLMWSENNPKMNRSQRVYSKMNQMGNSTTPEKVKSFSRSSSTSSFSSMSRSSSTKSFSSFSGGQNSTNKPNNGFKKVETPKKVYNQEVNKMVKSTSGMCKTITKLWIC